MRQPDPATKGLAEKRQEPALTLCRDVYAGTRQMRKKRSDYLPQFPKEPDAAYERRVNASVLHNFLKHTVRGLTGMVVRKDPVLHDDIPEALVSYWEDLDLTGTHGNIFVADRFDDAQVDGHVLILVEKDPVDRARVRTQRDQELAGERPYATVIHKSSVVRARGVRVGGAWVLTRFAYRFAKTEQDPEDEFVEREVECVREYRLIAAEGTRRVEVRVWEKRKVKQGGQVWVLVGPPTLLDEVMDEIPVAVAYTDRVAFHESHPPHEDLAHENVRHFQIRSDNDNVSHVAKVPIPVFTGVAEGEVKNLAVGAGFGVVLEDQGAGAMYLQVDGSSFSAFLEQEKASEQRMALLGLTSLVTETRAAETAESKRINKAEQDSALARWVVEMEGALAHMYRLFAKWQGIPAEQVPETPVSLNRDFVNQELDPQLLSVLVGMVGAGRLSLETLWQLMVAGEILPESFDPEEERERIEQDGPGDVAALLAAAGRTPPPQPPVEGGAA